MTAALDAVVVHWYMEESLRRLFEAWPLHDPRYRLTVVDNGSRPERLPERPAGVRWLEPGGNLGFAGGANLGFRDGDAPLVLLLNPDARPQPGALDALLTGFERHPEAAGLAPALESPDGGSQAAWQLRELPRPRHLLLQCLFLPGVRGPRREPPAGTPVAQPAAAALALRRDALDAVGALDESFWPAWHEDVDLARRLDAAGKRLLFWPAARFVHERGGSLDHLGYGAFLWIYYRNLCRYAARHHGRWLAITLRAAVPWTALLRAAASPLRRPRRARDLRDALASLGLLAWGALSNWRVPRRCAALRAAVERPPPAGEVGA